MATRKKHAIVHQPLSIPQHRYCASILRNIDAAQEIAHPAGGNFLLKEKAEYPATTLVCFI
jgi:hypothetical protein